MKVDGIMTREVATIGPDADLDEALARMDDADARHLPVVDVASGDLLGVVSERDLLLETGRLPRAMLDALEAPRRVVRDVMHHPPVFAAPDDSLASASLRLLRWGIGCLPVIDGHAVVGMLSEVDLLEVFAERCRDAGVEVADPAVADLMTVDVHRAAPDTPAEEARVFLQDKGIRHLPVASGEELVGFLSARDLSREAGRGTLEGTPIGELCSTRLVTLPSDARASRAAAELATHRVGALPIVDDGRLVGVLSTADLLGHFVEALKERPEDVR